MADNQWHVKRENAPGSGQFTTLFSGDEKSARKYVADNFPRPHITLGQDNARSDVQLHGPNGERQEHHGEGAVGADDSGWVDLNSPDVQDESDDDDEQEVTL